jgi:hypothetical protein
MKNDTERFKELMALADEGDENAMADLFKEFGYVHPKMAR